MKSTSYLGSIKRNYRA